MVRWLLCSVFALLIGLLASVGCKPAVGNSCNKSTDSAVCLDPNMILACEDDGKWQAKPCLGPSGCRMAPDKLSLCDTSIAPEASPCVGKGFSCTPDKKSMMLCQNSKWTVVQKCLGPSGCDGLNGTCDDSFSVEGEPCLFDPENTNDIHRYSCSFDKKTLFGCNLGNWKKVGSCSGALGCIGDVAPCDGPVANQGDFCVKNGTQDQFVCSTDKKSLLKCEVNGWQVVATCSGANGCSPPGPQPRYSPYSDHIDHVICDQSQTGGVVQPTSGAQVPVGSAIINSPLVSGGSVANASSVIGGMAAGFRRCYNNGLKENPAMKGPVRITAHIGSNGEVLSTSASGGGGLSGSVVSCLQARVASAQFSAPGGGSASIMIPINFISQ